MSRARDIANLIGGTTPDIILKTADGAILNLQTSDTTVTDGSVLGKINFTAPDEGSGTDALLVGASIEAVAEGTFAADNNATELVFKTGASAAAATKMVLTSAGKLGIGTSSPSVALEVNSGTDNTVAKFESSDAGAFIVLEDNGSTANGNRIQVEGDAMTFSTADTARLAIGSGGDIDVETGDIFFSTAGKGIVLGATSNTNANTLDDYEEGTWTPTLGGNESYNNQAGTYIKIGQKVTVWYNQAINAIGTGNPKLTSGLPFTVFNNITQNVNGSQISYFTNVNTNVVSLSACPRQNTSTIRYAMMAAAGVNTTVNTDIFKNSTDVYAHATYYSA